MNEYNFCWGGGVEIIEMHTFIYQGCFKLMKSDDKGIYKCYKIFIFLLFF